MPDIVLTTLNARYAHAAFGLRYLLANLGPLRERAEMLEFEINQRPLDILEAILSRQPRIVGIGVYIWNVAQATELVAALKRVRPDVIVILGGPEVSYETDQQEIARLADYVITGEADLVFAQLCGRLLGSGSENSVAVSEPAVSRDSAKPVILRYSEGSTPDGGRAGSFGVPQGAQGDIAHKAQDSSSSKVKIIPAQLPEFDRLALPYHLYTDEDVKQRVVYVEASRGCPFKCEFCLSSLDIPLRNVPLAPFLDSMQSLLDRGLQHFKFVDRTFNLNLNISRAILQFFLDRHREGLFLHFEMIPDRLPEPLRDLIRQFPPGALQFEVGIQSFNDEVCQRISRRQDTARLEDNLRFLRRETGVHIHADLIVGLPGEDLASFAAGFDRLVALGPQEIQVGILKRLRGAPIVRHDREWSMVYAPHPPYEVLSTKTMDFATLQRMRRFARYWDLLANSGNFVETIPLLWRDGSPFAAFSGFCDWLFELTKRTHSLALQHLAEWLFRYRVEVRHADPAETAAAIWRDFQRVGRSDRPEFLRPYLPEMALPQRGLPRGTLPRQARHAGSTGFQ